MWALLPPLLQTNLTTSLFFTFLVSLIPPIRHSSLPPSLPPRVTSSSPSPSKRLSEQRTHFQSLPIMPRLSYAELMPRSSVDVSLCFNRTRVNSLSEWVIRLSSGWLEEGKKPSWQLTHSHSYSNSLHSAATFLHEDLCFSTNWKQMVKVYRGPCYGTLGLDYGVKSIHCEAVELWFIGRCI